MSDGDPFIAELLESTSSWSASYVEYVTGKDREGFAAYAFIEDDDDQIFYQHALRAYDSICYLGCGGKSGVLAVYEKLTEENIADGQLFFVDRDTDIEPFTCWPNVNRTKWYSWESHLVRPEIVAWLLPRRLTPTPAPLVASRIARGWLSTIENYKFVLAKHTALLRTANVLDQSIGMDSVQVVHPSLRVGDTVSPADNAPLWFDEKVSVLQGMGVSAEDIERRRSRYATGRPLDQAKGKLLFQILRSFVSHIICTLDATLIGEFNSARAVVSLVPWDHTDLDYIREYTIRRLQAV
ncbi:DUF4435 domain-containing protein [Sphingomonas hankookensis]